MTDRRKRQWVALDSWWPHGRSMQRINQEFGPAGLALYVALITAAKRERPQGSFTYVSDSDALWRLGCWSESDFPFTFEAFITRLGELKKARRTRRGHAADVVLTDWEDWQNTPRTGAGRAGGPASPSSISRAFEEQKARLDSRQNQTEPASNMRQERERESEREKERDLSNQEEQKPPPSAVKNLLDDLLTRTPENTDPRPRAEQLSALRARMENTE